VVDFTFKVQHGIRIACILRAFISLPTISLSVYANLANHIPVEMPD